MLDGKSFLLSNFKMKQQTAKVTYIFRRLKWRVCLFVYHTSKSVHCREEETRRGSDLKGSFLTACLQTA